MEHEEAVQPFDAQARAFESSAGQAGALPENAALNNDSSRGFPPALTSYLAIFFFPAAMTLFVKFAMLLNWDFYTLAKTLDRPDAPVDTSTQFTYWEWLSMFRADLLLAFIVAPVGLTLLARLLPSRFRVWMVTAFSAAVLVALYAQLQVFLDLGTFLSLGMLDETIRWGVAHPEDVKTYIGPHLEVVLFLTGMVVAVPFVLRSRPVQRCWGLIPARGQGMVVSLIWLSLLALTAASWYPWLPVTRLHASVYSAILTPTLDVITQKVSPTNQLPREELIKRYREWTGAPEPAPNPAFWAEAEGYNVILFVLETAPARVAPLDGEISDFPNLKRLRERSWVASRHYTTSSLSNRAEFSLFSSLYPLSVGYLANKPGMTGPGVVQSLKAEGYETGLYVPFELPLEWEEWMMRGLGYDRLVIGNREVPGLPAEAEHWRWVAAYDRIALEFMKEDIEGWLAGGRRFVATYLPQIGHAPWPDVASGGTEKDVITRGRQVVALQDQWLGEILDLLQRENALESTLIAVTADHGIRTATEDPSFSPGRLDEYTFHVPFLLYAPGVLSSTETIDWLTSHIDVPASLLDLLGVEQGREWEQGSPLWDERIKNRSTYFWATPMAGVNGYHAQGRFYMWSDLLDLVFVNDRLQFENRHQAAPSSSAHREVSTNLRRMIDLQGSWHAGAVH